MFGVVTRRLRELDAVGRHFGQAHAEVVRLNLLVAGAVLAADGDVLDTGQEAGLRVAFNDVGINLACKLVRLGMPELDAVKGLIEGRVGFTTKGVADASGSHQVTFVGGVDEHTASKATFTQRGDRNDAAILFLNPLGAVEPLVAFDGQLEFLHVIFEDFLGDRGLKDPHGTLGRIHCHRALAFVSELLLGFMLPGTRLLVGLPDAVVEVTGEAADDGLVTGVSEAQATTREAAEVLVGADDDDGLAHLLRLNGSDDGGRGAAVDDDVIGRLRGFSAQ